MNPFNQFHQITTNDLLNLNNQTTNIDNKLLTDAEMTPVSNLLWQIASPAFEPNELTFTNSIWADNSNQSLPTAPEKNAEDKPAEPRFPIAADDWASREFRDKFFLRNPSLRREWWDEQSRNNQRNRYYECFNNHETKSDVPAGFEQNKWINPPTHESPYGSSDCNIDYNQPYDRWDRNNNQWSRYPRYENYRPYYPQRPGTQDSTQYQTREVMPGAPTLPEARMPGVVPGTSTDKPPAAETTFDQTMGSGKQPTLNSLGLSSGW